VGEYSPFTIAIRALFPTDPLTATRYPIALSESCSTFSIWVATKGSESEWNLNHKVCVTLVLEGTSVGLVYKSDPPTNILALLNFPAALSGEVIYPSKSLLCPEESTRVPGSSSIFQ
jgi:hypothetical protein